MLRKLAINAIKTLLWILDADHRHSEDHSDAHVEKFTHIVEQNFASDFGRVTRAFRTIPYRAWKLQTNTKQLIAADRHQIIRADRSVAWIEDLKPGDAILTKDGVEHVTVCRNLNMRCHMYSLEAHTDEPEDENNHLYYAGDILSHNTTCASAYLLWRAMFIPDTTILVTANKYLQALEIMDRIRYAYQELPDHIRAGAVEYNKGNISFDNGSRIIARATSADAGRGLSVTLLYCLAGESTVKVRHKTTGVIEDISLEDLYDRLKKTAAKDVNDILCFIKEHRDAAKQ